MKHTQKTKETALSFLAFIEYGYVCIGKNDTLPPFTSLLFVTNEDFYKSDDIDLDTFCEKVKSYDQYDLWDKFIIEEDNFPIEPPNQD